MSQKHILLASCNSKYNQEMAEAITKKLPQVKCTAIELLISDSLPVYNTGNVSGIEIFDICFAHSQTFYEPEVATAEDVQKLKLRRFNSDVQIRHEIYFSDNSFRSNNCCQEELIWPAPLSQLIFQIELLLPEISEMESKIPESAFFSQASASNNSVQRDISELNGEIKARLGLHLRIGSNSSKWLKEEISACLATGRQVYYLALMPVYQMQLTAGSDSCGSNLSDLLLAIHQNCPPDINHLGSYTQLHPSGYLQFRPPDRADDIICCEPEDLRQLIVLLRQKVESLPDRCNAWIDCQGLPLTTIARLAVLCDILAVSIPQSTDFASQTARRELGLLLAKLPSSCAIIEIEGADSHDAG